MALIVCPHCNKQISDQGSFCNFCGNPIRAVEPPETIPEETLDQMQIDRLYNEGAQDADSPKHHNIDPKYSEEEFSIYGQTVICNSSYPVYREILTRYEEEKKSEKLFNRLWNVFPEKIDYKLVDEKYVDNILPRYTKAIMGYLDTANHRLEKHGLNIPTDDIAIDINIIQLLIDFAGKYFDYYGRLLSAGSDNIREVTEQYWTEAQSKVTGLNYGMIGGGVDMMLYSLDNFFTVRKQSRKAQAEYNQLSSAHINNVGNEINAEIGATAKQLKPSFKKAVDSYLEQLCQYELSELEKAGVISHDVGNCMDMKQSANYCKLAEKAQDKAQNLGLALKCDPCNDDAYSLIVENDLENEAVQQLAKFVGLDDDLSKKVAEKIHNRIGRDNIKTIIKTTNERKSILGETRTRQINREIVKDYQVRLLEAINADLDSPLETADYCRKKIDELDGQALFEYCNASEVPVPNAIGDSWDYDSVLRTINKTREGAIKRESEYRKAIELFYDAKKIEDYESVIDVFKRFGGYSDSADYIEESEYWINAEKQYQQAVEDYKNAKEAYEFFEVKDKLEDLEDYKDSEKLAAECQRNIEELNQKERMQMEAEEASKKKFIKWRK